MEYLNNLFGMNKLRQLSFDRVGFILSQLPNTGTQCQSTGILIGPDLVLTTASSIYSNARQCYLQQISFCFSLARKYRVINFRLPYEYLTNNSTQYDYALLKLDQELVTQDKFVLGGPISHGENLFFGMTMKSPDEQAQVFRAQWQSEYLQINNKQCEYQLNVVPGLSGGIIAKKISQTADESNSYSIIGLHRGTVIRSGKKRCIGRRITSDLLQNLSIWQQQMLKFKSSIFLNQAPSTQSTNTFATQTIPLPSNVDSYQQKYNKICQQLDENELQMISFRVEREIKMKKLETIKQSFEEMQMLMKDFENGSFEHKSEGQMKEFFSKVQKEYIHQKNQHEERIKDICREK